MRLPLKWRLFHLVNYLLLFIFLFLLIFFVRLFFDRNMESEFLFLNMLLITGLFFLTTNFISNLWIFYRFFPNKAIPGKVCIFHTIITIAYVVTLLCFLSLCILGLNEELRGEQDDNTGLVALFVMFPVFSFVVLSLFCNYRPESTLKEIKTNRSIL